MVMTCPVQYYALNTVPCKYLSATCLARTFMLYLYRMCVCVCVCVCFYEIAVFPSVYYFKNNLLIQLKIPDIKFGLASFDA